MKLPNLIIDSASGDVIAFGYCDFTLELQPGQEQVQCPAEQLPPCERGTRTLAECYRWDAGNVIVKEAE